jgi:glyoxylase-like metal-dependent hydrolase (beta-lactamase superfamily II)
VALDIDFRLRRTMTTTRTASEQIIEEVTSWPGVEAGPGRRGELAFKLGRRQIGHLHGDHAAHFSFPKALGLSLKEQGRVVDHPVFPGKPGPAARRIETEADVRDVIELLRINYDRAAARHGARTATSHMQTPIEGLYASTPEPLPFAPSLHIRAFLLRREHGNVLVYGAPMLDNDAAAIDELGGIERRYLNHWHEAMFDSDSISAPLFVHAKERDSVAERTPVHGTFSTRHMLDGDLEAIPTPGHTSGATAYLWDSGRHRLLFTGDTIYLDGGEWVAAVLQSSDRGAYIESLELIRELDFDVLVPWAATRGGPYYTVTNEADARRRIDAILDRVRRGEDR